MDPNIWENIPRVSSSDNESLCKPFTEKEIKNALDQIKKTKLQDQIRFQLSSIKAVGVLLRLILSSYLMIFTIRELTLAELIMGSSLCYQRLKKLQEYNSLD